jgi:hypothetical protein
VSLVRKSPSVFENSAAWNVIVIAAVFVVAQLAFLVGVTMPEKF